MEKPVKNSVSLHATGAYGFNESIASSGLILSFHSRTSIYRCATANNHIRAVDEKAPASIFITHFPIFQHIQLHYAILVLG